MKRCKDCIFWKQVAATRRHMHRLDKTKSNWGKCKSPKFHYGYSFSESEDGTEFIGHDQAAEIPVGHTLPLIEINHDNIMIEGDEGWGAFMGKEFGCIHWEGKN